MQTNRKTKIFLLLIAVLLLLGCTSKKTIKRIKPPKPLKYEIKDVNALVSDDMEAVKPDLDSNLSAESQKIVSLLTDYTNKAFLKPKERSLRNNIFLAPFSQKLKEQEGDQWDGLSLGDATSLIKRLSKTEGEIPGLWIYFNDNLQPLLASLDFNFMATYELKDEQLAHLKGQGNFVLEAQNENRWKIIGYQFRHEIKSQISRPESKNEQNYHLKLERVRESTSWEDKRPITILLLGSDSRTEDIGGRSDAIMLIKVNPISKKAILVSFPRDARINIPGYGATRINNAMAYGGPQLAVRTIENYSGISIDYFAVTTFKGFVRMMDNIGGLQITINEPIHDRFAGAFLPAGFQKLNGGQVLAYSRARHIPGGDLTRASHQQHIVTALFEQLQNHNSAFDILNLIPLITKNITTNLSAKEMFILAKGVFSVKRENVEAIVLPGYMKTIGGASYIILNTSKAEEVFEKVKTL